MMCDLLHDNTPAPSTLKKALVTNTIPHTHHHQKKTKTSPSN